MSTKILILYSYYSLLILKKAGNFGLFFVLDPLFIGLFQCFLLPLKNIDGGLHEDIQKVVSIYFLRLIDRWSYIYYSQKNCLGGVNDLQLFGHLNYVYICNISYSTYYLTELHLLFIFYGAPCRILQNYTAFEEFDIQLLIFSKSRAKQLLDIQ